PSARLPPVVSMRSPPHQARRVPKFTFLARFKLLLFFWITFFRRNECPLLLRLYGHGNLAVEAYVQQLKNSVNIDMRRGSLNEFKVDDPMVIRIGGHVVLGNLVLSA